MKRSKHTLSHYHLLTADMGKLYPVGLHEALPGDTWQLSTSAMIRVSPLAAPVMHPVKVRLHHFFVPHRLVWDGWEDFITGGPDGNDTSTVPTTTGIGGNKSLLDYMGIDPDAGADTVNSMPLIGFNAIWNEYYRDQQLQTERSTTDKTVPEICWEKDYFTAARPFTQLGDDVTLPLGTQAPITGIGVDSAASDIGTPDSVYETDNPSTVTYNSSFAASSLRWLSDGSDRPQFYADLSAAGAIDINDFRRAFALQRYKEARNFYGARYTEYLRYLGITPSDARLQRPEYLGGGTTMINFSEVLQTGAEATIGDTGFGVGDMYGHGIAAMRTNKVRRFIEEHGYIHTLMSVRPKTIYSSAMAKHWIYQDKEDFYQRELEHIGAQEIKNREVVAQHTDQDGTFGFNERYMQYRTAHSRVSADFRGTLNYWHMARELPTNVALNNDFVKCDPTKRVHNVQTEDVLWCMVNNHAVARRLVKSKAVGKIL